MCESSSLTDLIALDTRAAALSEAGESLYLLTSLTRGAGTVTVSGGHVLCLCTVYSGQ